MPFQDKPRWFTPPGYQVGDPGTVPAWAYPEGQAPQYRSPMERAQDWTTQFGVPRGGGFSTISADDMEAQRIQKLLNREKLRQAKLSIQAAQEEAPFQAALQRAKTIAEGDAMAASQDAEQNYGKFNLGSGLGLGFTRPVMDTASDQARHAMALEFLANATKGAAPPTAIKGEDIGRNTKSVPDFIKLLRSGANFDPRGLSLADRDNYLMAIRLLGSRGFSAGRGE